MLSSASFLDRNLMTVISLDCAGQNSCLTMRFDSGYALGNVRCLSPCSLDGLKVFPVSFVPVPCLSSAYNTDDQPALLHWTVCLLLLQQTLAHQNFSRVCTTYLLRHFRASPGRLRFLRQSNRGRKRYIRLIWSWSNTTHLQRLELLRTYNHFLLVLQTPTVGPLPPTLLSGPKHSLDPHDNHHWPHLHLVNGLFQYLAMLIVTK